MIGDGCLDGYPNWHTGAVSGPPLKQRLTGVLIAVEAAVLLTVASIRIATKRSPDLVYVFGEPGPARSSGPPTPVDQLTERQRSEIQRSRRVGRIVERVAKLLPWHPTCLRQSLATSWMLRWRHIDSMVHLGVADVASMDAHAWVTVDQRVVNGQVGRAFKTVASFHG